MLTNLPRTARLALLSLGGILLVAGCDSLGGGETLAPENEKETDQLSLFEATNDLGSRMTLLDGTIKMSAFGAAKAAPDLSLTSIARVDPPGDTTRASHLTYNSQTVFAGYKAVGSPFKGGVDFLDATNPTTLLDINSLGSNSLDVQEVAYHFDNNALYVAGALDLSTTGRQLQGTPAVVAKVTNFRDPEAEVVGLTDNVAKSIINAPSSDTRHDIYVATDEQSVYRFNKKLGDQVRQEIGSGEIRSIAATENTVFAVDRGARLHKSDVASANAFSEDQIVSSGVGDLAIGRMHARKKSVLNGDRLFLALGSEGLAVVDPQTNDILFRKESPYYTSVTLHQDDPTVDKEPNELVYAARENGLMDIFKVSEGGIDTGDETTGLDKIGTFDLSELDGVKVGHAQVNQVLGVGCKIYVANSTQGVIALRIGDGKSCALKTGPTNDPPTAEDDSDETDENESVTTDVLANDSDPDGSLDASTVTVTDDPGDGSVTVESSGKITYTPDEDFTGTDTYKYTVDDDDGATSNEATVTIEVNGNNAPVADDGAKAISWAAFCTAEDEFEDEDVEITDTRENDDGEVVSIYWESDTEVSTLVLKAGPDLYNYEGGEEGGAASEEGDLATDNDDQSTSSPCPDGEDLGVKIEDLDGDGQED